MPTAILHNNIAYNQGRATRLKQLGFIRNNTIPAGGKAKRQLTEYMHTGRLFKAYPINLFPFLQIMKWVTLFLKRWRGLLTGFVPVSAPLAGFSLPRDRLPDPENKFRWKEP